MANDKIRKAAKENRVKFWECAERLGIQDSALSRKLRRELPEEEQKNILKVIHEIASERSVL